MKADNIVKTSPGSDRQQCVLPIARLKVSLVVAGFESWCVGKNPDLVEVDGCVSQVEFRVGQPGSGRHPLHIPHFNDGLVAHAVLMGHLTLEYDGNNLHLIVGVCGEACARFHHIIVENPQWPELNVLGVKIAGKRKEPECFQPTEIGKMALS